MRVCKDFFYWLQIGYILRIGYRSHEYVQLGGNLRLLAWVKVAVGVHGGLHLFMPQPVGDQKRGETHLDEKAGVAVTGVMYTYHLHPGCLASSEHFVPHKVLGEGEQPVTAF